MMLSEDFLIDGDDLVDGGDTAELAADQSVVRAPEIVWISDAETDTPEDGSRSIADLFREIELALGRLDFGGAEDFCWKLWSESRAIGAIDLAAEIELLVLALDSNLQVTDRSGDSLTARLDAARAYLADGRAVSHRAA